MDWSEWDGIILTCEKSAPPPPPAPSSAPDVEGVADMTRWRARTTAAERQVTVHSFGRLLRMCTRDGRVTASFFEESFARTSGLAEERRGQPAETTSESSYGKSEWKCICTRKEQEMNYFTMELSELEPIYRKSQLIWQRIFQNSWRIIHSSYRNGCWSFEKTSVDECRHRMYGRWIKVNPFEEQSVNRQEEVNQQRKRFQKTLMNCLFLFTFISQ